MPNNRGGTAEVTPFFWLLCHHMLLRDSASTWAKLKGEDAAFPELGTKYHFRERYM